MFWLREWSATFWMMSVQIPILLIRTNKYNNISIKVPAMSSKKNKASQRNLGKFFENKPSPKPKNMLNLLEKRRFCA